MVKLDLEQGQMVAHRREVAYEDVRRRDYCIDIFLTKDNCDREL